MTRHGSSVKTLVTVELVDSTTLPPHTSQLYATVDRAARDLIHRYKGREIDKQDSFFLLFDRPVDALLFTLNFHRTLKTLSDKHNTQLTARAGIHVGEVFVRENSAEDLAQGAQAIEVEGLAKPIAARLMSAAQGGQTLLTQAAFDLAKRAFHGEKDEEYQLKWLKHGHYQLQGVSDIVEIYEAGERGLAALKPPKRSDSVQRMYTGHTVAVTLGSLGTVIIAALLYVTLAPKETFAFADRDWVVIGEFVNHTRDPLLDDSLETAFRVALEQSPFASIVPHSSIRDTLKRMQRDPNTPLDSAVAIEVSLREGAKALISASISEIGSTYAIHAEIINPKNGKTVMLASATAGDASEILDALDSVSQKVRKRLGESLATIDGTSQALAKVTTTDLEALQAFTVSQQYLWSGSSEDGLELLELAVKRDPGFAMAHAKLASIYHSTKKAPKKAERHWQLALQNKGRLTNRERLYVEASSAWMKTPADMLRGWKLMSALYPNQQVGHHNLAIVHWRHYNNYTEAENAYIAASEIRYPWPHLSYSGLGAANIAANKFDEAIFNFRHVEALIGNSFDFKTIIALVAAKRYDEADQEIQRVANAPSGFYKQRGLAMIIDAYADRGMFHKAKDETQNLVKAIAGLDESPVLQFMIDNIELALAERTLETPQLHKQIRHVLSRVEKQSQQTSLALSPKAIQLAITARIGARNGMLSSAQEISASIGPTLKTSGFPIWQASALLLEAEIALQQGKAEQAVKLASESLAIAELYQGHETLARAHIAAGNASLGEQELLWLIAQRGRIFVESSDSICGCANMFNVLDWAGAHLRLARLKRSAGDTTAAIKYYKTFIAHWRAGATQAPEVKAAISELSALSADTHIQTPSSLLPRGASS